MYMCADIINYLFSTAKAKGSSQANCNNENPTRIRRIKKHKHSEIAKANKSVATIFGNMPINQNEKKRRRRKQKNEYETNSPLNRKALTGLRSRTVRKMCMPRHLLARPPSGKHQPPNHPTTHPQQPPLISTPLHAFVVQPQEMYLINT